MINSRSIIGFIVALIAFVLAIWLGLGIATDKLYTLIQFFGVAILLVCILLGRKVWLLMLFFGAINFQLIRGFSTVELGQSLFLVFSLLLLLLRRLRAKVQFKELEFWTLMIALCVVQVYARNPVGLNIFGAAVFGAKPYFVVVLSIVSYFLLSMYVVSADELKWAMRLTVLGSLIGIPLEKFRPKALYEGDVNIEQEDVRVPWLQRISDTTSRWLISKISPFRTFLKPIYMLGFLACVVAAAGSGYRNAVASVGIVMIIGVYYHHGFGALFSTLIAGAALIAILAAVNVAFPLPGTIQRALSPFPGTWETRYVENTENSTEWRVEMWKAALTSDYWIHNKMLGDGLGLTREEHDRSQALSGLNRAGWKGASGLTIQQESLMTAGGYHSGPVHTIRTVGYVGLVVLWLTMIRVAVHAHRQIMRCRNTPWFQVAMFFGIPAIALPIFWTFIFGEFQGGISGVMLGMAMVRLLERNLPLPAWKPRTKTIYRPLSKQALAATTNQ